MLIKKWDYQCRIGYCLTIRQKRGFMAKETIVGFKVSYKEKALIEAEAASLGFKKGKGGANISDYLKYRIQNSAAPIHRHMYQDLINVNHNLIKIGGLFNQYMHHLNRELKLLNDLGINENNKHLLKRLNSEKSELQELKESVSEMHKVMHKIFLEENA